MRFGVHAYIMAAVFLIVAAPVAPAFAATNTPDLSYECNLSGNALNGLAGCPSNSAGGYETTKIAVTGDGTCTGSFCGVRSDPGTAVTSCRYMESMPLDRQ